MHKKQTVSKENAMKKMLTILAATIAATAAIGQTTNQVLSRNAVGYIRITTTANKFQLVANPFKNLTGQQGNVGNILGTNGVPDSSSVIVWDAVNLKYFPQETFYDGYGWDPGTNVITTSTGFWLETPVSTSLYFMGEVPDSISSPTNTTVIRHGYQIVSFPYPVTVSVTNNTGLNAIAGDSDSISIFNGTNYDNYTYYAGYGWDPAPIIIQPGQGFWYSRYASGNTNWAEPKPYTWP
jgi:hypothetical protein